MDNDYIEYQQLVQACEKGCAEAMKEDNEVPFWFIIFLTMLMILVGKWIADKVMY